MRRHEARVRSAPNRHSKRPKEADEWTARTLPGLSRFKPASNAKSRT